MPSNYYFYSQMAMASGTLHNFPPFLAIYDSPNFQSHSLTLLSIKMSTLGQSASQIKFRVSIA